MAKTDASVIRNHGAFIWSSRISPVAITSRRSTGGIVLPLTVILRLGCVLEPTKEQVLSRYESTRRAKEVPEAWIEGTVEHGPLKRVMKAR